MYKKIINRAIDDLELLLNKKIIEKYEVERILEKLRNLSKIYAEFENRDENSIAIILTKFYVKLYIKKEHLKELDKYIEFSTVKKISCLNKYKDYFTKILTKYGIHFFVKENKKENICLISIIS